MKELSIFVDESGDFGEYNVHSPYYIISMVLHDQTMDISLEIDKLDSELSNLGFRNHVVHTEPLIRREEDYKYLSPNERRSIFTKLYYFVIKCKIQYKTFVFHKKEFEKVILYYDNGQHELNRILNTVFATELAVYDVRKVMPCDYKLFQAADLICTLELLRLKAENGNFTRSEKLIFHSIRDLKKDFLKGIHKKEFGNI